ncbi:hypothetical protein SAMD00019534_036590 [Acytostelium subglobosum LB1]|uniref:hypothetical protein n=1 Tax=Acytostelium subglobosum LB1 TaxID=1410327 RepID=UPI0006449F1B|nr:hypothetical protein SAMD00019534_036590 [Acytostelium subglobosum LB1]GAM20484.1 hypothetical protein SAMD00019534_036590 [Acytostelium subglobosum LB1]|eukprot:XP_012760005.1 hypothetical protein SAMD00019534_036590 [Acytostelium subglobosum LB1]
MFAPNPNQSSLGSTSLGQFNSGANSSIGSTATSSTTNNGSLASLSTTANGGNNMFSMTSRPQPLSQYSLGGGGMGMGTQSLSSQQQQPQQQSQQLQLQLQPQQQLQQQQLLQSQQQQNDKHYIQSRIFAQDRVDLSTSTDKRKPIMENPGVSSLTTSPPHTQQQMQHSPSTPYSPFNVKSGGYNSMRQSGFSGYPSQSNYSQQQQQQQQNMLINKDYIPKTSIYDDPSPSALSSVHGANNQLPTTSQSITMSFFETPGQPNSLHQLALPPPQQQQQQQQLQQLQQQQQQLSLSAFNNSTMVASGTGATAPMMSSSIQTTSNYFSPTADSQHLYSDKYDKRWVTVFGFPLASSDVILDVIETHAHIVELKYPHANAHWIHIRLESESVANDLLTKNGLIHGNYMIGITPCKDIIKSGPLPEPSAQVPFKELEAYAPHRSNYDPMEYSTNQPNTSSNPSIFSKISEYVFGL